MSKLESIYGSIRGKILHIDLTNQSSKIETVPKRVYELLLGGKGLGIYLLHRTKQHCKALSKDNDFIIVTGPLTGTLAPCANKFGIVTKSPATGLFLDSYSSGEFGPKVKFAGFDAIILHGKNSHLGVVSIYNDEVTFHDAKHWKIAGLSPLETEIQLKKEFGNEYSCLSIGLAGERSSPIAGVFTQQRCSGRGGAGAVLGSKNVKAILIRGTKPVNISHPEEFRTKAWVARRYLRSSETTVRAMPKFGTANILNTVNESHALPTKNFQKGNFEHAGKLNGTVWYENYWNEEKGDKNASKAIDALTGKNHNIACWGCPISCSKIAVAKTTNTDYFDESISELDNKIIVDGPEYETLFALGSNLLNHDHETILEANYLCDYYGIDTISTGVIISFLMELYEREVIPEADLDGIRPKWGDPEAIVKLIRKIGSMEGCGALLGKGVKVISEKYEQGKPYAMHVKGLEVPGYDPRRAHGMGLCYSVSDRGACHLHSFTASVEILGNWGGADPYDLSMKKMELFLNMQAESAFIDSSILCFFTLNGLQIKEVLELLHSAAGKEICKGPDAVIKISRRILALTRLYNYREGATSADDTLPKRFLEEIYTDGRIKGKPIKSLESTLQLYYELMGWDKDGKPRPETLKELKINELDIFEKG